MLASKQDSEPEVLKLVNKARIVLEMPSLRKLPRGLPETSRECVLGRSLGVEILLDDQDRAYALVLQYRKACRLARIWRVERPCGMWNGWAVLLPKELNNFVHEFDAHSPQLSELTSAGCKPKDGVRSSLRHLRFDWVNQHNRVADLIERAREARDRAQALRSHLSAARHDS